MKMKVVTDSTSDLPPPVVREFGITMVPALVQFRDKVYHDGIDLSTDEFYRKLQTNSFLPKTSPASPGTFGEVYSQLAREADGIVSIHVSAKMSATYDAARLGSVNLKCPISIIDSQTASMACGLLVILAARAAREGASLSEIEALVRAVVPRTVTYGVFSTLEYLYKGGRIGRAQAFLGSMLKLNPILAIRAARDIMGFRHASGDVRHEHNGAGRSRGSGSTPIPAISSRAHVPSQNWPGHGYVRGARRRRGFGNLER
jgi:DegV family protein with EDD domain